MLQLWRSSRQGDTAHPWRAQEGFCFQEQALPFHFSNHHPFHDAHCLSSTQMSQRLPKMELLAFPKKLGLPSKKEFLGLFFGFFWFFFFCSMESCCFTSGFLKEKWKKKVLISGAVRVDRRSRASTSSAAEERGIGEKGCFPSALRSSVSRCRRI